MGNKIKVSGYAQKVFYNQGIEYRNFSPDLVGNQLTSDGGTSLFTAGNFSVTTNLDSKFDKNFVTNTYSDFITLEDIKVGTELNSEFYENNFKLKLNLDDTDVLNYAFFGSLREYIRVSLENIIITWPASINVTTYNPADASLGGPTVLNYIYDPITNKSSFDVSTDRIINQFDINYLINGSILNTFNETNNLRNLTLNYSNYVISNDYGKFKVIDFTGASASTLTTISFVVEGHPFSNFGGENIPYHIQPNDIKIEEFFTTLNAFENNLLNRKTTPIYTSTFKTFSEMDSGAIVESSVQLTWPTSDNYNIDFNSLNYELYVNQLISIAELNDDAKSNLITRFLVSKSISEFDSIPDISSITQGTNGEKMNNALKIYGREFDVIKNYSDGVSFANVVTYNKKNNTPDATLKNLARVLGWGLTSAMSNTNIIDDYLTPKDSTYSGQTRGYTNIEAEIELWRRLILNTPWIWKSKGTRKAIEFLFQFIGVPDGLMTFNEYVYVADKTLDVDNVKYLMNFFNDTEDITSLNIDLDGYPKILPNNSDMYFQKGGMWYRRTGGENPDIDILTGNNPHIGPYDGGKEYINQFTNCLIPNFSDTKVIDERFETKIINLFTNYNNGTFDECYEESGLGESFASSIKITDIKGMNVSNCFDIITNITTADGTPLTSDDNCDTVLEIEVGKPIVLEVNCDYINFTKQPDGLILLSYSDGSTSLNVHPECCNALEFISEIGENHYYVCRWKPEVDMNDCSSYIITNEYDEDEHMIYEVITGGTTTILPKEECCFVNELLGVEVVTGGFYCVKPIIRGCGTLRVVQPEPVFGDIQFEDSESGLLTTVVEYFECCVDNGFKYRISSGGYTCYKPQVTTLAPTVSITCDECCDKPEVDDSIVDCQKWKLMPNGPNEVFVNYYGCDVNDGPQKISFNDPYSLDSDTVYFCASTIIDYNINGYVQTEFPLGVNRDIGSNGALSKNGGACDGLHDFEFAT